MSYPEQIRARIGDLVRAYGQSYRVEDINDYGQLVCRNLNEDCMYRDEVRTFDDYEVDVSANENDPEIFCGSGI